MTRLTGFAAIAESTPGPASTLPGGPVEALLENVERLCDELEGVLAQVRRLPGSCRKILMNPAVSHGADEGQ